MAIVALCAQRARSAAHTKETAALTVVRKPCQSACSRPRTFASFPQNPDGLCQSACSRPRTFANFPQNPDGLCQSACSRPRTFANFPQSPDGLCQSRILYPDPKHGLAGMLCACCTSCIGGSLIGMNLDIADVSFGQCDVAYTPNLHLLPHIHELQVTVYSRWSWSRDEG